MPAIIIPSRWTQQPQSLAPVDWNHPLCRDMTIAWSRNRAQLPLGDFDCRYSGADTYGLNGYGIKGDGASTFATLPTGSIITTTGYGATPTTGTTWLAVIRAGAADSQRTICNSDSTSTRSISFRLNTTSVGLSNVNAGSILNFTTQITANELATVCISGISGSTDFYKNGRYVANNATAYTQSSDNTSQFIGKNSSSLQFYDGSLFLLLCWKRKLLQSEGVAITENPWQVFKPIQRRIYFDVAAAPGGFKAAWVRQPSRVIGAGVR
jgi:hypothetical protein